MLRRDERGSSVAAVLLVTMALTALGLGSVQVAQHSNDVTSVDRERLQTIQAAEAGINDAIRRISSGAGCDSAASSFHDLMDRGEVIGSFRTRIDPEAGTSCGQTPRRVIHSWGYAPTGGTRALRHLEVAVELVPQAGFGYTLFAEGTDGTIYVKNSGTIDGDAYAENLDQSKNNLNADSIVTSGSIVTRNNAVYAGRLWAAGNVDLGQNSTVGGAIIAAGTAPSSAGNVVLGSNSVVGGDVLARGSVTQNNGVVVHGSVLQGNANLPPPPALQKPVFTYDPMNYTPAPTSGTSATITTALNASRNSLQGTYRATDGGTVVFPDNVTVTGPLTVIASGKVDLGRTMSVSGGPFQVVVVALGSASDAIDFARNNFTSAGGIDLLLYTLGGLDGRNHASFKGAIYANTIDQKNTFTISRSTSLQTNPPPGFTWDFSSASEFAVVPTLWREIVPGAPPA